LHLLHSCPVGQHHRTLADSVQPSHQHWLSSAGCGCPLSCAWPVASHDCCC
jgi:hypothetical protein